MGIEFAEFDEILKIQMNSVEHVHYSSVGKTIGIYVTINGESILFTDSTYLREQIAKEIPELVVELKAYWDEQSDFDGFHYITDENFERILNFVAAASARGNPNV